MIAGVLKTLKREKKEISKDRAVQSQIGARNLIWGKKGSKARSIHSKKEKKAIEKAPDQDMQVSGGQFQGKLQSAIQESLILKENPSPDVEKCSLI